MGLPGSSYLSALGYIIFPRATDDKLTFVQIPTECRKPYGGLVSFALGIILFIKQHVFISFFWY